MNSKFPFVSCMIAAVAAAGASLFIMSGSADSSSASSAAVPLEAGAVPTSERTLSNTQVSRVRRLVVDAQTGQVRLIELYTDSPHECEGHVELEEGPNGTFTIVSFECVNECAENCHVCTQNVLGHPNYWCECSDAGCIVPP